ncbi:unnamed protein product [Rotaria sp. Silwood2]|nr:unnamed protein product [Rotaria sp. Silwood2]CAF3884327.1 unnamed protein product [Rotaria sp. Silwood2]
MRHFEALHNVPPYNYNIPDPELSPHGRTQAAATIETIKNSIPTIDLIVCSPLTRALQTYLLVFNTQNHTPLIIHPDLQEVCTEPCDIGRSINQLMIKFPSLFDQLKTMEQTFGNIEWLDKTNPESTYSPKQIKQRAKRFLQWLINRSEQHIFIISHNLMLKELIQGDNQQRFNLHNGEIRTIEYQC